MTDYRLDIFDTTGARVAQFADRGDGGLIELAYTKRLMEPGLGKAVLHGLNPDLGKWVDKGLVEVWRRNTSAGLDWYCDFRGFFLGRRLEYTSRDIATLTFPGDKWLLGTRVAAHYANTTDRTVFRSKDPETIAKNLVFYNLGSGATVAGGRLKEGAASRVIPGASVGVAPILSRGTAMDWACFGDNVLTSLQKLAQAGSFDWDLNYTGTLAWTFEYYPLLGVDRTATLTFSLERDNAADPVYTFDRSGEVTSLLVGGKGEDTTRRIVEAHGTTWSASNDIEGFLNDSSNPVDTNAALTTSGVQKLVDLAAQETFSQTPRQTANSFYGKDYCVAGVLGDRVQAKFRGITATQRITGVTVSAGKRGEVVQVEAKTL